MPLALDLRIKPSPSARSQEIAGETVIIDLASEQYFGLNAVGTRVWQLIGAGSQLQPIFDQLCAEYDADQERIRQDLVRLIAQLIDAGLAQIE